MMDGLSKQRQRQAAIGLLALAIALMLAVTVLPIWVANASRQAAIDDASERLQRYQLIAARDSELLPKYESMLRRQRASGKHLRSETVALAGAELQRRVTSISSENGARVMSTQILPTSSEKGFIRVSLKVRLIGPLTAVLQSLYDLETDDVYMFVDNATLSDPRAGRTQLSPALRPMNADFELIAYLPEET